MTDLSPATRALLDAARDGLSPDRAALRRVRGRIDAAVVGGSSASAIGLAVKLSIVATVAAVVIGAIAYRSHDRAETPTIAFATSPVSEPAVAHAHDASPPRVAHIEMTPAAPIRSAASAVAPSVPVPPPPAAAPTTVATAAPTLAREVELVDAAMAALRDHDPAAALASVRVHREETRNRGQLAEDAAAIEIEALCQLHDRRVVVKLEAFDARWPESAQRSRLTTACP